MAWTPTVLLTGAAAAVSLGIAAYAVARHPRKPAAWLLGGFLLLIALNQGLEVVRKTATSPEAYQAAFQMASLAALADPLILWLLAGQLMRPGRFQRGRFLGITVATLGMMLLTVPLLGSGGGAAGARSFSLLFNVFTVTVYGMALALAMDGTWDDRRPVAGPLVLALAVAAIPVAGRIVGSLFDLVAVLNDGPLTGTRLDPLLSMPLWIATVTLVSVGVARRVDVDRPQALVVPGLALAVLLSFALVPGGALVVRLAGVARWVVFGLAGLAALNAVRTAPRDRQRPLEVPSVTARTDGTEHEGPVPVQTSDGG